MQDMSEFGPAASFLRKSDKELMVLQTIAFDGKLPIAIQLWVTFYLSLIVKLKPNDAAQEISPILCAMPCCLWPNESVEWNKTPVVILGSVAWSDVGCVYNIRLVASSSTLITALTAQVPPRAGSLLKYENPPVIV